MENSVSIEMDGQDLPQDSMAIRDRLDWEVDFINGSWAIKYLDPRFFSKVTALMGRVNVTITITECYPDLDQVLGIMTINHVPYQVWIPIKAIEKSKNYGG